MRSSHNLINIADNREYFIGLIEGYYCCTSVQGLILSQMLVSSNNCSTFKYYAVLVDYSNYCSCIP